MFRVEDLCFSYRGKTFLENVSFDLGDNRIVGILGANGAGKTTLIECLEGIRRPDSGEMSFNGLPVTRDFRNHVGIQFQEAAFFQKLKVKEIFGAAAALLNRIGDDRALMDEFCLTEHANKYYQYLSGGMKQKVAVAVALMNREARLVFLDEPTTGLDVFSRKNLWAKIRDLKREGKMVILTTHYIEEAEELCDDILILDRGRVIEHASPPELNRIYCREAAVEVELEREMDGGEFISRYRLVKGIRRLSGDAFVYEIKCGTGETAGRIEDILTALLREGYRIIRFATRKYDLETAFFNIIGYSLDESGDITA